MILYQDIAGAITMIIQETFPDVVIYGDEVKEGYKKPSFFVGLMPVNTINHTKSIQQNQLLITISYFSDTKESLRNYHVMQRLKTSIGNGVGVVDRFFTIGDVESQKVEDDIYQMVFSINYYEQAQAESNDSKVKEIIYK